MDKGRKKQTKDTNLDLNWENSKSKMKEFTARNPKRSDTLIGQKKKYGGVKSPLN